MAYQGLPSLINKDPQLGKNPFPKSFKLLGDSFLCGCVSEGSLFAGYLVSAPLHVAFLNRAAFSLSKENL